MSKSLEVNLRVVLEVPFDMSPEEVAKKIEAACGPNEKSFATHIWEIDRGFEHYVTSINEITFVENRTQVYSGE